MARNLAATIPPGHPRALRRAVHRSYVSLCLNMVEALLMHCLPRQLAAVSGEHPPERGPSPGIAGVVAAHLSTSRLARKPRARPTPSGPAPPDQQC